MIKKDEQGNVMALELSDLNEEEALPFGFLAGGLLNIFEPDDVEITASEMSNNSAAGLLLIEDTWAIPLKQTILNAGAVARAGGLVAPEVVQAIEAKIEAETAKKNQAAVGGVAYAAGHHSATKSKNGSTEKSLNMHQKIRHYF